MGHKISERYWVWVFRGGTLRLRGGRWGRDKRRPLIGWDGRGPLAGREEGVE